MPPRMINGKLMVPLAALGEGVRGDGMVLIGPEHPRFAEFKAQEGKDIYMFDANGDPLPGKEVEVVTLPKRRHRAA